MTSKALALTLLAFATSAAAAAKPAPTKEIMHGIFEPLAKVMPYGFDGAAFVDPRNKDLIAGELAKLAQSATLLEDHGRQQDRAFEFVARSLARDARDLQRRFDRGSYEEARFTLHNITANCMACHSSLPETAAFPGAERLFAAVKADALPPLERAQFQVVSRRFDAALDTYEALFRSRDLEPGLVTTLGSFADYLKVAISVKSDLKRPQAMVEHMLARPNLPLHVRHQLERWLMALKDMDQRGVLKEADLATARKVLAEGRALMEFPRDRDGLVHYVVTEALLTRYLRGRTDRGAAVGEAYYLLGVATALTEHSFWLVRSDFYLESAIRLAPAAPFAPKAYALLDESMRVGYTGSAGTRLPDDVAALLSELRRIVEQAHGKI